MCNLAYAAPPPNCFTRLTSQSYLVYNHDMATDEREILAECACHNVRMAARNVTRTYDEVLRPTGLRATQLAVLLAVSLGEAPSIAALADFMQMDRSTLTRNLQPLEENGLVALGAEGRYRARPLNITEKGRARLRDALPLWRQAQEALKKRIGPGVWRGVHESLTTLTERA